MNSMLEQFGIVGAVIAGLAYVPQIVHMVREKCTYGLSLGAFTMWLVAAVLITIHAVAIGAAAFILLGFIQISASAIIVLFLFMYKGSYCASHLPEKAKPKR